MWPALNQGPGLQVLREELDKEKQALREARRTLEEKEEVAQKDGEKIEQLEQGFATRSAQVDTPCPGWADLRQAALDRPKEENIMLLQRFSTLETSSASASDATHATNSGGSGPKIEPVPCASWIAVCQEKAQLEEELRQNEKRTNASPQASIRRQEGRKSCRS